MECKKEEILIKSALEKIKRGRTTRFLDPKEANLVEGILRKNKIDYHIYKPFEMSNAVIFYKDEEPNISILKTKNKNFKHSDVMGSYFSLGLDKSIIGDIVIKDDMVYIIVLKEYEQFLIDNFTFIKNEYIVFEKSEWIQLEYQYEELNIVVISNRLDVLISKLLKLSRNKTNELFAKKEVCINYNVANNNIRIKQNDIFSIRRHGKYIISSIEPFKNKYKITLKKYI